jgi:hypothetical protein
MSEQPHEVDQIIVDAVEHVRDRFGALGLRQLMEEAQRELREAEAALAELAETEEMTAERRE